MNHTVEKSNVLHLYQYKKLAVKPIKILSLNLIHFNTNLQIILFPPVNNLVTRNSDKLIMVEQIIAGDNPDEMYWINDDDEDGLCWSPGRVVEVKTNSYEVECIVSGDRYEIDKDDPAVVHPTCLDGVSDLLSLGDFNEGALLHTIRERHAQEKIYTSIGSPILLSINPFQRLSIFTTTQAQTYRKFALAQRAGGAIERPEPHLFMVAEDSYQDLMIDGNNQSIIITGESGAGKTEATKIVLAYLARAGKGFNGPEEDLLYKKPTQQEAMQAQNADLTIEKQVLDSNPLLEAFGNAKTFKNNNSSRFGKFIQVNFNATGMLHSASIVNYLLEKSRICYQYGIERNFHIFYQVLQSSKVPRAQQGPLTKKFLSKYRLGEIDDYHYVNQSDVQTIPDVDDVAEFELTLQCMRNVHFSDQEIVQIIDATVAILNLGNVEFGVVDGEDLPRPSADTRDFVTTAARLLGVDLTKLVNSLTTKRQIIGKEVLDSPLTIDQAYQARDSLCKHLYGTIFSWIVQKINLSISVQNPTSAEAKPNRKQSKLTFVGLLDIFGFEIFAKNSFEQLCINYANEKLQQQFNQHMFTLEQEEYKQEGIEWKSISFKDNQHTIDMIEEDRAPSIFKILDEQFMLQARGTDKNLLEGIHARLSHMKSLRKPDKMGAPQFVVVHYAGAVTYDIDGFVEKNKDSVTNLITEALAESKCNLIKSIYQPIQQEQAQKKSTSLKGNSLSNQFRQQLSSLIVTLRKSSPRYIRCIKPNHAFTPTDFNSQAVLQQLRCAGMLEAIRIRKAGFSIRIIFKDFIRRYRPCLKGEAGHYDGRPRDAALAIFENLKAAMPQYKDKFQVGFTKVFLKEETRAGLEQLINSARLSQVVTIQAAMRGKLTRRYTKKLRSAREVICKRVYKRVMRQRLMDLFQNCYKQMLVKIVRIQKARRRLLLHRKIMQAVNRKIAFQKQERYRLEMERQQKEQEVQEKSVKPCIAVDDVSDQLQTQESTQPDVVEQMQDFTEEQNYLLCQESGSNGNNSSDSPRNQITAVHRDRQASHRQIIDMNQIGSLKRSKAATALDSSQRDFNPNMTGNYLTSVNDISGDLMTTINGDQSSYFTSRRDPNLEEKEDQIEQLKAQIELLESERDNKWMRQVEELEDDKAELEAKNKKWIAKYDEKIESYKTKFDELHKQIKQLQQDNCKLEVAAKYDTSLQQRDEEIEDVRDQLHNKQQLIEQFESHLNGIVQKQAAQEDELEAVNEQMKCKIADLEAQLRDRNQELSQTQEQLTTKDEHIMEIKMELESHQNESKLQLSMSMENSFEQSKNFKRDFEKAQLQEKKALEELNWLKSQLADQKAKIKILREANDELQEQNLELKSNSMNRPSQENLSGEAVAGGLQEFERSRMQQAIDETSERCKALRDENRKLDAENNFFHMSTAIFIKLKPVMETEKQLCYSLAQLNTQADTMSRDELEAKRDKIIQSITKCRDTQTNMEVKLKKVLDRIKKQQQQRSPDKKTRAQRAPAIDNSINMSQVSSLLDMTNQSDMRSEASPAQSEKSMNASTSAFKSKSARKASQAASAAAAQ